MPWVGDPKTSHHPRAADKWGWGVEEKDGGGRALVKVTDAPSLKELGWTVSESRLLDVQS